MLKRITAIILVTLLMCISLTGCGGQQTTSTVPHSAAQDTIVPRTVTNLNGSVITVQAEVNRVAAVFGPAYEKIVVLGAEDKIMADGDFHISGWPWSNVIYKRLNNIPGIPNAHTQLNIEDLLKYKLQVVFDFPNAQQVQKMKEAGIVDIPSVSTGKFEDTKNMLRFYGKILGNKEEQAAEEYAKYFDEKVKMITDITSKIPENERPSVYFANQKILLTHGKSSDIPEVIKLAGGRCVSLDVQGGSSTQVNVEQLLQWNPQFIFVDHAGSSGNEPAESVIKKTLDDTRYQKISAVENQKVFICPTGAFFWDSGVQKVLLLMWMAQKLHPTEFSTLDMSKELKTFYTKFFNYNLSDDQAKKILAHLNP
ncbi:ABC transporter substrate-binding protein [Desulfosporosinus sp. OT]|uniref:ABC transporter substrate-binding protein n=1 Tax=Desulfosporosinus sp. OT TaxID=913865 RepID=UPI00111260DE|nr:ABC transporter substrate-binding protein [Desulfosporosinus sp. OT]